MSLNVMRYMTFEISKDCDLAVAHAKCPAGHPDRFKFGRRFGHWMMKQCWSSGSGRGSSITSGVLYNSLGTANQLCR